VRRGERGVVRASGEAVEDAEKKEEGRDRGERRRRSGEELDVVEEEEERREIGRRTEGERRGEARRRRSRRWRRKFTTRRPPKLPTLPRRLSALSAKPISSCVHSPCLPSLPTLAVHLHVTRSIHGFALTTYPGYATCRPL